MITIYHCCYYRVLRMFSFSFCFLFIGLFSMAFFVDLCLLDSVPLCLDFIVFWGGSGVLSHGADCFMIFRVDKIWMFGTLSVYGLKVALHSLQLLKRACLYGCTCNDSNNNNTHTHTHTACDSWLNKLDSVHFLCNGPLHCRKVEKRSRTYICMRVHGL